MKRSPGCDCVIRSGTTRESAQVMNRAVGLWAPASSRNSFCFCGNISFLKRKKPSTKAFMSRSQSGELHLRCHDGFWPESEGDQAPAQMWNPSLFCHADIIGRNEAARGSYQ